MSNEASKERTETWYHDVITVFESTLVCALNLFWILFRDRKCN